MSQLTPIRDALDKYWYEIDSTKEGDYFWSHEWVKHGSCAVESSMFETELKYFGAGLDLRDKYDLYVEQSFLDIIHEKLFMSLLISHG